MVEWWCCDVVGCAGSCKMMECVPCAGWLALRRVVDFVVQVV